MLSRFTRSVFTVLWLALAALLLAPVNGNAQTFRGGINGTVTHESGAVVAGATVEADNIATGVSQKTITSSDVEYIFQDMQLVTYKITVTAAGFKASVI